MSLNPLNDISAVYVAEVLKPQLGQDKPEAKTTAPAAGGAGEAGGSSDKKIRQAVYDIRYRARREDIPLDQAYSQYMSHTSMNAVEKDAVKDKLGMGAGGGGGAVKEEVVDEALSGHQEKKFQVRVKDKLSGKAYVRSATRAKINKLRSNPNISHVEMTKYGSPYEDEKKKGKQTARVTAGKGLDPVGKEDSDVNNDRKVDKTDKYLQNRRNVRGAAIAKRKPVKEAFSNWREDLREVVDDEIASEKKSEIKEKKVNNKVTINPKLSEGIELLESFEITEEYLFETVNTAAEYFIEQGLNEHGVDILIEELGLDEFVDFVFQIKEEDLLAEARAGGVRVEPVTAAGKKFKSGKPTGKSLQRLRDIKAKRTEAESKASEAKPSGMKAALQRQSAVAAAAKKQPKKPGLLDRVAGAVNRGIERHKAATSKASELASQTFKTAKKAAGKVGDVAKEVGKGASGAAKLAGHVASKGLGEEVEINEGYKDLPTSRMVKQATKHGQKGGMAHLTQKNVKKTPKGLRTITGSREREAELEDIKKKAYKRAATMTVVSAQHDPEKSQAKSSLNRARGTKSNIRPFVRTTAEELELQEKITAKTDVGTAIKDFRASKSSQLSGRTKEERTKAAIAAVLTARRGGKKLGEALDSKIVDQSTTADDAVRSTQSNTVKRQQQQKQRVISAQMKTVNAQKAQLGKGVPLAASYELDGEVLDELRRSEKEGKGSVQSPPGFRGQNIQRGSKGGRHFWSGGEGGSRIERGKSKNEPGSQHQRLNPPEPTGRQLQRGSAAAMQRWHSARD